MNSYELSRAWFDWSFENPEKIKPIHSAIYFMSIEHCNRLGWKDKFGFPTTMVMDAIGVKSYNTYIKALNDLVDFGFIKMIEVSKNQYSANIIALSKNNKALYKALDKALVKHKVKQHESTVSIDKQYNKEQVTSNNSIKIDVPRFLYWFNSRKHDAFKKSSNFKMLTSTDENNYKKLINVYEKEDFEIAIKNLFKSKWAIETKMVTPSHFLRIENFNKYLGEGVQQAVDKNKLYNDQLG